MPRNYLIELSQYLTQDVKNGQSGANGTAAGSINTEDIKNQPWYFGTISRNDCDILLTEKGVDGDFMVRESETNVSTAVYQLLKIKGNGQKRVTKFNPTLLTSFLDMHHLF